MKLSEVQLLPSISRSDKEGSVTFNDNVKLYKNGVRNRYDDSVYEFKTIATTKNHTIVSDVDDDGGAYIAVNTTTHLTDMVVYGDIRKRAAGWKNVLYRYVERTNKQYFKSI
jgi:hypothetical protein